MSESCSILAHVRNSKGEVVESRLFKDLLHHLSDRELAKEYYKTGTDEQFLNKVRDKAEFDENGEITFNSLRKLAKINLEQEKLLATLNDDIGAGKHIYQDAITKLQNFNRTSGFRRDYMATIQQDGNKYQLSVVPRTSANEASLETEISNRTLRDRLMYYLNKAGVSVDFLEEGDRINGRYSTVNAKKTADGMYNLIRVANGEKLTRTLAEEAGHFAVGSLGDSPLVKRLTELLDPKTQQKILGNEYDEKSLGASSRREVAGTLVGRAFMDEVDRDTPWNKLAMRVADLAKRIYATIKKDDVLKASIEANEIARNIARGFMSSDHQGDVEEALKIRETLYSSTNSLNTKKFREVINGLSKTVSQLKAISNDVLADKVNAILGVAESGRLNTINATPNSSLSDGMALDGIAEALSMMLDMVGDGKEINNLLDSVDFLNTSDFMSNMASNGRKLRQVHVFATNSIALQKSITEAIKMLPGKKSIKGDTSNVQVTDNLGNVVSINLDKVLRDLAVANEFLMAELMNKERQFFLKFCEDSLGSKYVYRASRVIWNIGKDKKINREGKTKFITFSKGGRVDLSSVLESLESDIDLYERFLGSMSNNPDIIGQIVDKVTKMANMQADALTNQCWDALRILESRFKKFGIKQEDLFERFDDGTLTGNIISEFHWGEYERDWKEFKDNEFENFKATTPNLDDLSEFEKALRWDMYFRPLAKDWRKKHSIYDQNLMKFVPNDSYRNHNFDNLMSSTSGLRGWYNDYMLLKTSLDSRLPEGSTIDVRMPQFKGTLTNIIRNQNTGLIKATGSALRSKLRDTFCESSEDTDFGSDNTYNSEDEERFANSLAYEKEKIHRLPIYGINKLQDMSELSTDIFQSTLAYAGMANTYLAMNQIVDTLEVGSTVLKERKVGGDATESERERGFSHAYNRYLKFLDKQVYGINSTKHKIYKGIIVEKVVAALSNFSSKYFLGGNVFGGAVNALTGLNEIFKEAIAGEEFSLKDFKNANKLYFKYFVQNWMEYGEEFKENKVGQFIRHFNVLGENRTSYRNWNTDKGRRIYNMFSESLFLPYKSGDHYMQSIAYLALAQKIKVFDESGNRVSLFNAYSLVDNVDDKGNVAGKTLEMQGNFFKSKDGVKEYKLIQSILDEITNSTGSGPFGSVIKLNKEQQDYLNNKRYSLADLDNTVKSLEDDAYKLTWSIDDESSFMDKCREINNRMHGIYNNQDKTAFQGTWFGNALLAMRGYALGMIERRYSAGHYSTVLGHDVEGSLNTLSKVIFTDSLGFGKTILAIIAPMSKKAKLEMYRAGFSKNQIANMKRNWGDMLMIAFLWLLKALSAPGGDDDDDDADNDIAMGLLYYFANRLHREQSAFNTPTGIFNESAQLMDLVPAGASALWDVSQMAVQIGGIPFASEDNPDFFYQSDKEGRYEKGDSKGTAHFWRMFPYLRSVYTFEHPYEAAKSFDYGRAVKTR